MNIWALVVLVPILWVISASFKPIKEVFEFSIPSKLMFENYIIPFTEKPYLRYLLNSMLFAAVSTISNLFFCSLAGYGFAKFRFFGRKVFFIIILSTMMLSIHVIMVPLFIMINKLNWSDTWMGLLSPFLVSGFGIFLMRQNIVNIPNAYIESARIDGASEIRIYFNIILPYSKPILSTLGILTFMFTWDEFIWPLVVATTEHTRTISVGIATLLTIWNSPINQMAAVSVVGMLPILIAYLFCHRYFIESLSITGLKE